MAAGDQPPDQVVGRFEAFYRERYRPLVGVVYALTGNRWVAEDLTQEARPSYALIGTGTG